MATVAGTPTGRAHAGSSASSSASPRPQSDEPQPVERPWEVDRPRSYQRARASTPGSRRWETDEPQVVERPWEVDRPRVYERLIRPVASRRHGPLQPQGRPGVARRRQRHGSRPRVESNGRNRRSRVARPSRRRSGSRGRSTQRGSPDEPGPESPRCDDCGTQYEVAWSYQFGRWLCPRCFHDLPPLEPPGRTSAASVADGDRTSTPTETFARTHSDVRAATHRDQRPLEASQGPPPPTPQSSLNISEGVA